MLRSIKQSLFETFYFICFQKYFFIFDTRKVNSQEQMHISSENKLYKLIIIILTILYKLKY